MAYRLNNPSLHASARHNHGQKDAFILSFLVRAPYTGMTSVDIAKQIGCRYDDVQNTRRVMDILTDMGMLKLKTARPAPPLARTFTTHGVQYTVGETVNVSWHGGLYKAVILARPTAIIEVRFVDNGNVAGVRGHRISKL